MMTVAEYREMLNSLPDDMLVMMMIDDENCVQVNPASDIEEIITEFETSARVFLLRPLPSVNLSIPTKAILKSHN
jgi:hypothetical protein